MNGPKGVYHYADPAMNVMEASLIFDNSSVVLEYLFRYPLHEGLGGKYADLLFYRSSPVPFAYHPQNSSIVFDVTTGGDFDNGIMVIYAHASKWLWDFYPRDETRQQLLDGDAFQKAKLNTTSDAVSTTFLIGHAIFTKRQDAHNNLESRFRTLNETSRFVNPVYLDWGLSHEKVGAVQKSGATGTCVDIVLPLIAMAALFHQI